MTDNKKNIKQNILMVIIVLAFFVIVISLTYAYFKATISGEDNATNIKVDIATIDSLTLSVVDSNGNVDGSLPLNLVVSDDNFSDEKGNLNCYVLAKVNLIPSNKRNYSVTEDYFINLNILNNNFVYSIDNETPDLLMRVITPDGGELTNISGLTYKSVRDRENQEIKGFDITTKTGLIKIANPGKITASTGSSGSVHNTEQVWKIEIIMVNYDALQNKNAGKIFEGVVTIGSFKSSSLIENVIGKVPVVTSGTGLYHHTNSLSNSAKDDSYRYAGANPNNYVKFSGDDTLYRIIGFFKNNSGKYEAKLIRNDSIGSKQWNANNTNDWHNSTLRTYLNGDYYDGLPEIVKNNIKYSTWSIASNNWPLVGRSNVSTIYQNEIVNPIASYTPKTIDDKIGLMYISDYLYAAPKDKWGLLGYADDAVNDYRSAADVNWMYNNQEEWTLSRRADKPPYVHFVSNNVGVYNGYGGNNANASYNVRPVFYLNSNAIFTSGVGSENNPYIVEYNRPTLANYIIESVPKIKSGSGLYHHDGTFTGTDGELVIDASDYSYRYAGSNPNNYVKVDGNNDLYRIIGLFKNNCGEYEVKLIKNDSIGTKPWDSNNTNNWHNSTLKIYLNDSYYNGLPNILKDKIKLATWNIAGNDWRLVGRSIVPTIYHNEIVSPKASYTPKTINDKIGLMYISDYLYAAPKNYWELLGYADNASEDYRTATSDNWMANNANEWTLTRRADKPPYVHFVNNGIGVAAGFGGDNANVNYNVRPVFYLSPFTLYFSGDGTQNNPYMIK